MSVLTAFYDLEYGPISYDFVTWLVRALKEARSRRLHVVVVPKENGIGGFSRDWGGYDEAAARWRLWHIVVASCPLAGATVTLASSCGQALCLQDSAFAEWWPDGKAHFMGPLVDAARNGEAIPMLRASEAARRHVAKWFDGRDKIVTLTLRQQGSDPARNSKREDWLRFRDLLKERGYRPVVLEDTVLALDCEIAHLGSIDPDLRLALYERAAMNFCGNNGPQELLKFSSAPYRIVGLGIESWREHFKKHFHMEYGEQLPWAGPTQRLVYEPDSFEVLKREFEEWGSATSS